MASEVRIKWSFPNLILKLKRHERELELGVLASMQTNRGMLFDSTGTHNGGKAWKQLKCRDGMPLSDSGRLRKSIAPRAPTGVPGPNGFAYAQGDLRRKKYFLGSNLHYAAMANWGTTKLPNGVLVPKNAMKNGQRRLVFKCGNGKTVFATKVKIPARRYDRITLEDKREIYLTLRNLVEGILFG